MRSFSDNNFLNRKVLLRVDFNVPLNEKLVITDDTRIRETLKTINKILDDGGAVIIMSHLGRPKSNFDKRFSLTNVVGRLKQLLNETNPNHLCEVHFVDDCVGEKAEQACYSLKFGNVLVLENLRFYKEEEEGNTFFAEQLSKLGNFYVNDAFGAAHRNHASTSVIAQFFDRNEKCFGYLMESELNNANKVLFNADKPFTAVIGGAKVSDKILIIRNLLSRVNNVIIGGGMAYTFLKALGFNVGSSIVENDKLDLALSILDEAKKNNVKFFLPLDSKIADKFANDSDQRQCSNEEGIPDGWMGLDIGLKTADYFSDIILKSKTILWNGPMGVFEMNSFEAGTKVVAESVAKCSSQNNAFSLVGGGDSVAAVNKFNLRDKISFISTGGGALLEYFEGKILPGVDAMNK